MNTPVNILLVDDEPRNLEVLEGVLQRPDYNLVHASGAQEALLALLNHDFAVLVLDIQMPEMSGIELAHLIKKREKTRDVPIIFLTAFYQDEQRMLEGYNVGAVDYLTKPVNPQVLRSKVGVFVDLFRQTAALQVSNASLESEVAQRLKAETALREANDELEARVETRTAALREARDKAEHAGRAKDDFLAALSHELRTPLNPVLLIASEAANNSDYSAEVRGHFATIRKNVELEARLIDDLLDLTRITRGKLSLELKPREIHGILEDALATIWAELDAKQIRLRRRFSAERAWVAADNVRLQQVFWNVLKNAIKFTPEGGTIIVATRNLPSADRLVVEITDTGIGLTPAEMSSVFEAFAQGTHAESGSSHRFGGLGLGLTISRSLIEHHGGTLRAESEGPGKGATFLMELPLCDKPAAEPGLVAGTSRPTNPPMHAHDSGPFRRILLVEDHEPTRKALQMLLKHRGFDVLPAASLAEARALASQHSFDLLISDIGLPDGTGFELMSEMRTQYGILGIALTGYGMEEDIGRSHDAGFTVHLTKPVVVQSLDKALAELAVQGAS